MCVTCPNLLKMDIRTGAMKTLGRTLKPLIKLEMTNIYITICHHQATLIKLNISKQNITKQCIYFIGYTANHCSICYYIYIYSILSHLLITSTISCSSAFQIRGKLHFIVFQFMIIKLPKKKKIITQVMAPPVMCPIYFIAISMSQDGTEWKVVEWNSKYDLEISSEMLSCIMVMYSFLVWIITWRESCLVKMMPRLPHKKCHLENASQNLYNLKKMKSTYT